MNMLSGYCLQSDSDIFGSIPVPAESIPPTSDPTLLDRIADVCCGGSPTTRRNVIAALLVDGLEAERNDDFAARCGIKKGTAVEARQRGLAALRRHGDEVVALLEARRTA